MSNTSPSRINEDQIEKVLIGAVLLSILIMKVLITDKEYLWIFYLVHIAAFIGLVILYLKNISKFDYWTIMLGALLLYPIALLCTISHYSVGIVNFAFALVLTVAGLLFIYHSIKKSIEYKAFESLGFLLGVFLAVLPILSFFLGKIFEGFPLLYNFGIAFIIGTIMYGENLWDQYPKAQQKFILLTLLIALSHIIAIASKQF